ncbi:hypothetical protein Aca07nite_84410 [Actinoplanes capillaceus]|uniref:Uncharacterized protein n=1 Tax=Actinoplanes campanulatus TaxID=113559 RepID=A0ABQ3WXZ6_9ACTN|nr:hypothetical protein Aca07nite_84410 [Actinoplanes capillaceus]
MNGPGSDQVRRSVRAVYGLIEWDGAYQPTVIGCCADAVLRDISPLVAPSAATSSADSIRSRTPMSPPRSWLAGSTPCTPTPPCRT